MWRALAFLLLLPVLAPAVAADEASAKYQALLAAAKRGDTPVDWQALRFAYADSPQFDLFGTQTAGLQKAMFEAFKRADYAGAIAQAKLIIDKVYVDIDAHIICDLSYRKLGDAAQSKLHHDIVIGLLDSIRTGDGKTPATAFTVITVGEEYSLLHAWGMKPTGQALIEVDGHMYDKLDAVDEDGTPHSFYFLIDRIFEAEKAMLEAAP